MSHRISLTRIIAINWYGFNQIFDVDDMTLISGAFGTGKSALLDLIQQVMLGDGWKANQAASGLKSRGRDLVGYCLCDTNHENNGERHFLRRSGVTIIALEFTKPTESGRAAERETWGMRIEYSNPSAKAKKTYFCVPDRLEYADLSVDSSLLDDERFRTKLRRDYDKDALFPRQQDYLEEMATARHLYFDRQSFRLTFPKAIAFEPETNIETFIREFILEASPLNVTEVRESLQSYVEVRNRLEEQEHEASFLTKIREHNVSYEIAAKDAAILEHIQDRLKVAEQEEIRDREDAKVKALEARNREDLEKKVELKERFDSLTEQLSQAAASLHSDPEAEKLKQLKEKIEKDRLHLKELKEARQTVSQFLQTRQRKWIDWLALARSLGIEGLESALEAAASQVDQLCASGEIEGLKRLEDLPEHFQKISHRADISVRELESQEKSCKRRLGEIKADLKRIENQQTPGQFPLFERLHRELGDQVVQLGRTVEVREDVDTWWPVLESLLDTERSTIISADEDTYQRALKILSAEMPSPHEAVLNPSGLGNSELSESQESILSKLEVANTQAQTRLEICFGDIVCCDRAEGVRSLSAARALSPDGYFKDGAASRRLKVEGVALTLGTRGLQRMKTQLLLEQETRESDLEKVGLRLGDIRNWLLRGQEGGLKSHKKPGDVEGIQAISSLEKTVGTDEETLKLLETPERLERVEKHQLLVKKRDDVNGKMTLLKSRLAGFENEALIPRETKERAESRLEGLLVTREASRIGLSKRFSGILDTAINELQAQWMAKERSWRERENALQGELRKIQASGVDFQAKRNSERRSLQEATNENGRRRHPHYQDFNLADEDNAAWDQRLELLETVELVQNRLQAESRRVEWQQRLQEQVLNELTRRMTDAEEVIRSLRRSLSQPIGDYRYEIRQRRDTASYGNIWRLLDSGFEGTDPLAAMMQESEVQSAMKELMAAVDAGADAKDKAARLLDYRNYHHYDIEKIPVGAGADGQPMNKGISLSRRGGNLSGGESQVPFFISMLAAFRRVYSQDERRARQLNRLGLVVMDEAFSKLSSDGIADCLALARSFDLQLILAFPPEKLGVMVEHAQTVIVVQKEVAHDADGLPTMIENTPIRMVLDDAIEALD